MFITKSKHSKEIETAKTEERASICNVLENMKRKAGKRSGSTIRVQTLNDAIEEISGGDKAS